MKRNVISIDGVFDTEAAAALRTRIGQLAQEQPLTLDFTHAREVYDFALAVIAHALAADGVTAHYQGLLHHQERMLQYLGFPAST